ncbi:hypothetical protein PGB90_002722 [Kerria lacca]
MRCVPTNRSKKIGPYSDAVHTVVIHTASLLYTQTLPTYAIATNVSMRINNLKDIGEILSRITDTFLRKYHVYNYRIFENRVEKDFNKKISYTFISSDIDNALEQLLNRVLNHYVSNWYSSISADSNFHYEIRVIIQHIISTCCSHLSQVKFEDFLYKKTLPIYFNHINSYDEINSKNKLSKLHIAVHSRKAEILYLQNVSKCLLKYILPKSELSCKSCNVLLREILCKSLLLSLSDAACNPAILNTFIFYYLKGNFQFFTLENKYMVEKTQLLQNFIIPFRVEQPYSAIRPDVATIMKDEDLLNIFMCFLKNKHVDDILQFCIDIENFNERIFNSAFENKELDYLYRDAWDLYSVYFSNRSPNCIKFPKDLASALRKTLSKDVLKLKSSNILYEAYTYVYSQLSNYCHEFHNSSEFYSWLYGQYESTMILKPKNVRSNSPIYATSGRKTGFEFGSKLNKIKDVLKSNSVQDGQMITFQNKSFECEISTEIGEDIQIEAGSERNLSTWKISIPTVGSRLDPVTNKAYTVFVIQIQAEDNKEWIVERRPIDFYSLDVKLSEFHGTLMDAQLPSRRLLTTRLESIQLYEEYLHKLIQNNVLKSSELLYAFLTSVEEFETEDSSLGKLFRKSVPNLRKERGQNLEPFLVSFFNSCKTNKYEWKPVNEKQSTEIKYKGSSGANIYENNFNIKPEISMQVFPKPFSRFLDKSIFEKPSTSVLYLGIKIYNLRIKIVKFLLSLQSTFGGIVDQILLHLTRRFFHNILTSRNISYLINVVEKIMFDTRLRSNADDVKNAVIESLNESKMSSLYPLYKLVYETVQDPIMNKQLFYRLLDAALFQLFPELNVTD